MKRIIYYDVFLTDALSYPFRCVAHSFPVGSARIEHSKITSVKYVFWTAYYGTIAG